MKRYNLVIKNTIISYLDNQKDNKPVCLFLHGWANEANVLSPLFNYFLDDYRVIAIDFPGFGYSKHPTNSLTVNEFSKLVTDFLDKLKIKPAHFITHSFGGRVAIYLADFKPDYFLSLTLINCGGIKNTSLKVNLLKIIAKTGKFLRLNFLKNFFYQKIVKEPDAIQADSDPWLKQTFRLVIAEDLQNKAKNIKCPTLILWGEQDQSTPLWQGEKWHKIIKHSQFFTHQGDHFFFLQDPQWSYEKIKSWLSGLY